MNETSKDFYPFQSAQKEVLFNKIIHELRCTVCQNQSLAESEASIAVHLRQMIYEQVEGGMREKEIKSFVIERYGEFASFNPPIASHTFILWSAPIIMCCLAAYFFSKKIIRKDANEP